MITLFLFAIRPSNFLSLYSIVHVTGCHLKALKVLLAYYLIEKHGHLYGINLPLHPTEHLKDFSFSVCWMEHVVQCAK